MRSTIQEKSMQWMMRVGMFFSCFVYKHTHGWCEFFFFDARDFIVVAVCCWRIFSSFPFVRFLLVVFICYCRCFMCLKYIIYMCVHEYCWHFRDYLSHLDLVNAVFLVFFFYIFIHVCFFRLFSQFAKMNTCFNIIFVVGLFFIHILPPEKKRKIYYYFCLLFCLIFLRVFFFHSTTVCTHSLYIHGTSFHILFLSVFRLTFQCLGMSMTIILLLVTCLLCYSFVYSTILFLFIVSCCIVP